MSEEVEVQQGKNMADAAKAAGVERFIFSSLINVSKATNGKITAVRHFDGKAEIEAYAKSIGVPGSYVMPAVFMSVALGSFNKVWFYDLDHEANIDNTQGEDGVYRYAVAFDPEKTKIPFLNPAQDMGKFVGVVLLDLPGTLNQHILASSGYVTPKQAVAQFSEATGEKAETASITWEMFRGFVGSHAADELEGNFKLIESPGYYAGEPADGVEKAVEMVEKAGLGPVTSWKDYVAKNFSK
jgi:uncharacterized protein YbjT (DUF2867 family)